jgi:L-asparaginase II
MSEVLVEVWRGPFLECQHRGDAVVVNTKGEVVKAWGDPSIEILPRSSSKMLQALPLVESGAADKFGLGSEQLALACASHNGNPMHTEGVQKWLSGMNLGEDDLRCGSHWPTGRETANALVKAGEKPCQFHNNCSGKHSGFLTLNKYLGGDAEYVDINHPVQKAALAAFEEATGENSSGYGIDGCSAPNFATSLKGLATAVAQMSTRSEGSKRLIDAMAQHPLLVAGEGRACSELMAAIGGRVVLKTGAEGVFVAILPDQGWGVALKIEDGATRASECAIAAILVQLGVADAAHLMVQKRMNPALKNAAKLVVGDVRPADVLVSAGV